MAAKRYLTPTQREKICRFLPMIPVMRSSIELSALLVRYPWRQNCKNDLLHEAFWFAIRGINYTAVLRLYELIDPFLHAACTHLLGERLLVGRGRDLHATNPDFEMLRRYRHALIGHYVRLEPEDKKVLADLRQGWGDVQQLLLNSLQRIDELTKRLRDKALCKGFPNYKSDETIHSFETIDIDRLVAAANTIPPRVLTVRIVEKGGRA